MDPITNTYKSIKTIGELKEYIKNLDDSVEINFYSQRCYSDCYLELYKWDGFDGDGNLDEYRTYLVVKTKDEFIL